MGSKPEKPKIWTPKEKLDDNTKRMAWILFVEWWKAGLANERINPDMVVSDAYALCLSTAKIVRKLEEQ